MADKKVAHWLPLEEAAALMKRSLTRIKSQMRNGRIQRDRHFRKVGDGPFELNVTEYLEWLNEEKERRKPPFLERVRLSIEDGNKKLIDAATEAQKATPTPPPAPAPKKRPKLIPISAWAEETFGEYAPSANTIRAWVRNGRIYPMPTRIGGRYYVSPDAEYFDPAVARVRRMTGIR